MYFKGLKAFAIFHSFTKNCIFRHFDASLPGPNVLNALWGLRISKCVSVLQVRMDTCINAPPLMFSTMTITTQNLCMRHKRLLQISPLNVKRAVQTAVLWAPCAIKCIQSYRAAGLHFTNQRRGWDFPPNQTTDFLPCPCSRVSLPVRVRRHTCHRRASARSSIQTGPQRSGKYGNSCHQTALTHFQRLWCETLLKGTVHPKMNSLSSKEWKWLSLNEAFLKIFSFMFHRWQKGIRVWNEWRMTEWSFLGELSL